MISGAPPVEAQYTVLIHVFRYFIIIGVCDQEMRTSAFNKLINVGLTHQQLLSSL